MAAVYDIVLDQGRVWKRNFIWQTPQIGPDGYLPARDGNGQIIYNPVNLTGYHARMQVRRDYGTPALIDISDVANAQGVITLDALGNIWVTLYPAATAVVVSESLYEIELTGIDGFPFAFAEGRVRVNLAVVS